MTDKKIPTGQSDKGQSLEGKAAAETPAVKSDDEIDSRRRALIRAGWAVPAITAVPGLAFNNAYAQSPHSDAHNDSTHIDHDDVPHDDAPHNDVHGDTPHGDGHMDQHGDVLHGDSVVLHGDGTILHTDFSTPHADTPSALHVDFDFPFHGDNPGIIHADIPSAHSDTPGVHTDSPGLHVDTGIVNEHTDSHLDVG